MSFEATKQHLIDQKATDLAALQAIQDNIESGEQTAAYWTAEKAKVEGRIAESDAAVALLDGAFD